MHFTGPSSGRSYERSESRDVKSNEEKRSYKAKY